MSAVSSRKYGCSARLLEGRPAELCRWWLFGLFMASSLGRTRRRCRYDHWTRFHDGGVGPKVPPLMFGPSRLRVRVAKCQPRSRDPPHGWGCSRGVSLYPETLGGSTIQNKRQRRVADSDLSIPKIQGFGSSGTCGVRSTHLGRPFIDPRGVAGGLSATLHAQLGQKVRHIVLYSLLGQK